MLIHLGGFEFGKIGVVAMETGGKGDDDDDVVTQGTHTHTHTLT